jgi:predicted ester cyclase
MSQMRSLRQILLVLVTTLAFAANGCGKKKDNPEKTAKTTDQQRTEITPEVTPVKPLTAEQKLARVKDCWAALDAADAAKVSACYGQSGELELVSFYPPSAAKGGKAVIDQMTPFWTAFPDMKHEFQLVLADQTATNVAAVVLGKGTNTGPFMGPPTGKKLGILGAQALVLDEQGGIVKDAHYVDQATLAGQLGMNPMPHPTAIEAGVAAPEIVIGTGSDTERANRALVESGWQSFNAHNADELMARYADDAVFHYVPEATGETRGKAEITKKLKEYYVLSSDVKSNAITTWAAGDYVVSTVVTTGTNDGAFPGGMMKATGKTFNYGEMSIYKIERGKIKEHWIFANGMAFAVQLGFAPDPGAAAAAAGDTPREDEAAQ